MMAIENPFAARAVSSKRALIYTGSGLPEAWFSVGSTPVFYLIYYRF